MRAFNQYILALVLAASIVNTVLAFAGQQDITAYFTINVIAYLAITVLHAFLNPRARQLLSSISFVLFGGFLVIVIMKVIEVW